MSKTVYDRIRRYVVRVACEQPLHIGSADGEREGILRHPSTGKPFVQASSIAGVLSDYVQKVDGDAVCRSLFGDSERENGIAGKSRVVVLDGRFLDATVKLEMRTRCAINKATGSVDAKQVKGTRVTSGTLLTAEYIGTGSELAFVILVYGDGYESIEDALAAVHTGKIRLGGQNTSGFGRLSLQKVLKSAYDMAQDRERKDWARLTDFYEEGGTDVTEELKKRSSKLGELGYTICIQARLDRALLVKANMIEEERVRKSLGKVEKMPDFMNITNARNQYIIPGTSLKGVFRGRMEIIADYFGFPQEWMAAVFEQRSKLLFEDVVIQKERSMQQKRIHLNKISGTVKNKALFSECVTGGETQITVHVDAARLEQTEHSGLTAKSCIALLLYAVRDLAIGAISLGSGASIGRGLVSVGRVEILESGQEKAAFSLEEGQNVQDVFVTECLEELRRSLSSFPFTNVG